MASAKLKEAIHVVVQSCDNPSKLGATRLNKILWFADSIAYRKHGQSITGGSYVKRQYGPVPAKVLEAIRELEDEQTISVREVELFNGSTLRQFFSLKAVNLLTLSEDDRFLLESMTDAICSNFTAAEISDLSHDQIWEAADLGEEIPLYATFAARAGEITPEVRKWADGVLAA